jgi:MFS family permease
MPTAAKSYPATTWFITVFTMFFGRGFLYSSWSSRGPEVQERLGISITDMGLIATLFAAGAILGVMLSGRFVAHRGSRPLAILTFAGMPAMMALAVVGVVIGSFPVVAVALFLYGLPFGAADFVSNVEGSELDRASATSRIPMLHGGYSIGVLVGASLTALLVAASVPLEVEVGVTLVAVGAYAVYRVARIPAHHGKPLHDVSESTGVRPKLTPAGRKRVTLISSIAFVFILAEGSAAIFIPLALTAAGRTQAEAAFAYTVYALGMAVARVVGGKIVDRIGRTRVVFWSSVITAVGIALFAMSTIGPFELPGALLWGLGGSLPIAMTVSAVSENTATANRSLSTLWTWVYFGNLGVGPILGGASAVIGIFAAFLIPVAFLLYSATISGSTKPDPEVQPTA